MVAIFTGAGTGFERGSGAVLGGGGMTGSAVGGRSGEQVMLNAANGNLIVSQRDEFLVGRGPDAAILRTYNSRGDLSDDNGDNWRMSNQRRVHGLTGTLNTAGSTVRRTGADGSVAIFTWDSGENAYVSTEGSGAHDRLRHDQMWRWTDGETLTVESYGGPDQQLSEIADTSGNRITFAYQNGKLWRMATADGGTIDYSWSGNNIGATVTTYRDPATGQSRASIRTRYEYDSLNRLKSVEVDLSPDDNVTADGNTYVTTYSYHADSRYIAAIAQSDGSQTAFTYDAAGRVERIAQAVAGTRERVTTIAYESGATNVTDPAGQRTRFEYNGDGSLRTLIAPPATTGEAQQVTRFTYTYNGDVDSVTDAAGRTTRYAYDLRGNSVMTLEPDGGVVIRTFNADNQLLTEARDANRVHNAAVSFSTEGWGYAYNPHGIVSGPVQAGHWQGKNFIRGHYRATAAGQILSIGSANFAAQPGEMLYVGTGLEAWSPIDNMTLAVWWSDADGNVIGSTDIAHTRGAQFYDTKVARTIEVPPGAVKGRLELYGQTAGAGDGHILLVEPTVVRIAAGRTEAPAFGDYADGAGPTVTRYVYDANKRLAYVVDGEGGVTQRSYDAFGQVERTSAYTQQQFYLPMLGWNGVPTMTQMNDWLNGQDRSGAMVTGYRYDAQGNVIEQVAYGGTHANGFAHVGDGYTSTSFQYDRTGQLIGRSQRRGSLQADQEARLGRFLQESGVRGGSGPTLSKRYVLNPGSRRTTIDADILKLDSWDGEALTVHLNGTAAFSFQPAFAGASQDGWSGQISVGGITGTWSIVSSGTDRYLGANGVFGDRAYRMHLDLRGTDQAVVLGLGSTLDQERADESFGVDNIVVAQDAAFDDFETGAAGWTLNGQTAPILPVQRGDQGGTGAALGPIGNTGGNEALAKTYQLNPAQPRTDVDFEFLRIDSWDDEKLSVFLNGNRAFDVQLHVYGGAAARSGSFAFGALRGTYRVTPMGDERQLAGTTLWADQRYRVQIELEGAGAALRVGFGAGFDEPVTNESVAIDSVRVGQPAVVDTFQSGDLAGWSAASGTATIEGSGTGDRDVLPSQERFVYDGLGRLIASTDANGATTRIVFDDRNSRTIMALATGLTTVSTYNRGGELIASSRSGGSMAGGAESFVYDTLGRPRMRIDASGNASYWLYDDAGRKVADIAHGGQITEYRYNAAGQSIGTIQHGQTVARTHLDTLASGARIDIGQLRPAAHGDDIATWDVYDGGGRLSGRVDASGAVVEYGYTINDQIAWTRSYHNRLDAGTVNAFKTSPPVGLIRPATDSRDSLARNFYDRNGRLIGALDGEGYLTRIEYDAAGRKTRELSPATVTAASLRVTGSYAELATSAGTAALDHDQRFFYDNQGLLRFTADGAGRLVEYRYDSGQGVTSSAGPVQTIRYARSTGALPTYTYASMRDAIAQQGLGSLADNRSAFAVYDRAGRLAYAIDAEGAVVGHGYDAQGLRVRTTAFAQRRATTATPSKLDMDQWARANATAEDRTVRTFYDAAGRERYTVDGEHYVTGSERDADGRVLRSMRWDGRVVADDSTTIAGIAAQLGTPGVVTAYGYDPLGRQVEAIDGEGVRTRRSYGANGLIQSETHAFGTAGATTTGYQYDGAGRVRSRTLAAGTDTAATTLFEYDGRGNLVAETDALSRRTGHSYDNAGRRTATTNALNETVRFEYDGFDNVVRTIDARGHSTYRYYDKLDRVAVERDAEDYVTETDYNLLGDVVSVTRRATRATNAASVATRPVVNGDPADAATRFRHDRLGRVIATIDAESFVEQRWYDAFGNAVQVQDQRGGIRRNAYDRRGLLTGESSAGGANSPDGPMTAPEAASTDFDPAFYRATYPDLASLNDDGLRTHWTDHGWRERRRPNAFFDTGFYLDTNPDVRASGRNPLVHYHETGVYEGRRPARDAAAVPIGSNGGTLTRYTYDARGNMIARTEAANQNDQRTTLYRHDRLGRVTETQGMAVEWVDAEYRVQPAAAAVERMLYDLRGNLIERIDPRGGRTLRWYDALDRRIAEVDATGTLSRWTYDAAGNMTSAKVYGTQVALPADARGAPPAAPTTGQVRETVYGYDALNRVETQTIVGVRWGSGAAGHYATAVDDLRTTFRYDANGNVVATIDAAGTMTYAAYDRADRKLRQTDGEGYATEWTYDAESNIVRERRSANRATSAGMGRVDMPAPASDDRVTTFAYDRNGRRTRETRLGVVAYKVEDDGKIVELDAPGQRDQTVAYAYDAKGLVYAKTEATGEVTRYGYDRHGRLRAEIRSTSAAVAAEATDPTTVYFYDALGNLNRIEQTSKDGTDRRSTVYRHDAAGRMTSMTDASGHKTTYRYNIAGDLMIAQVKRTKAVLTPAEIVEANKTGGVPKEDEATIYTRDILGRVTTEGRARSNTQYWVRSDDEGNDFDVVRSRYNSFGELSGRGIGAGSAAIPLQETYHYDNAGRLVASNAGDGVWRYTVYDKAGHQTLVIANLDQADLVDATIGTALAKATVGNAAIGTTHVAGIHLTFHATDLRGMVTSITEPFAEDGSYTDGTDGKPSYHRQSRTRETGYTAFGEVAWDTDFLGNRTEYSYNAMGRMVRLKRPQVDLYDGGYVFGDVRPVEHYFHDRSGRKIGSEDALGRRESRRLLKGTGYGSVEALVTRQWHADGTNVRMDYNEYGDLTKSHDELGRETVMTYDSMGRLKTVDRPGDIHEYYAYDELGQRIRHWNAFHSEEKAAITRYDAQGRVITSRGFGGDAADSVRTQRLWRDGATQGDRYLYGYWQESVDYTNAKHPGMSTTINHKSVTTHTDVFGRVLMTRDMGLRRTTNEYDLGGRLTKSEIRDADPNSSVVRETTFTTLNTGLVARVLRKDRATDNSLKNAMRTDATYDRNGRKKTEKSWRWTDGANETKFQDAQAYYNALGWRIGWEETTATEATPAARVEYRHDMVGNIITAERYWRPIDSPIAQSSEDTPRYRMERFKYDARNRVVVSNAHHVQTSREGQARRYDHVPGEGSVVTTYDALGRQAIVLRLSSVTEQRQINGGGGSNQDQPHLIPPQLEPEVPGEPPEYVTETFDKVEREDYTYADSGGVSQVRLATKSTLVPDNTSTSDRYAAPDAAGRLAATYDYDKIGRLTKQIEYSGDGKRVRHQRAVTYDDVGRVSSDTSVSVQDTGITRNVTTFGYANGAAYALGNALTISVTRHAIDAAANGPSTTEIVAAGTLTGTTTTENSFDWYGGAVLRSTSVTTTGQAARSTVHDNDIVGTLRSVTISDGRPRTVDHRTDLSGQVLDRRESASAGGVMPRERTYRFDGEQMLYVGNDGTAAVGYAASLDARGSAPGTGAFRNGTHGPVDHAQTGQGADVVNSHGQGSAAGSHVVRGGETLADVARSLWGDGNLWYRIAQANGLGAGAVLFDGQRLSIPAGVTRSANAAASFAPYDAGFAIGDVSASDPLNPTNPVPRGRRNRCGALGAVLVAAVAVVAAVYLAPALTSAVSGLFGAAASATGTAATVSVVSGIAGGALAGAAGSIAGQGLAVAAGLQDRFSWKGVALAAIGGGVGGGIGGAGLPGAAGGGVAGFAQGAVRGVLGNVLTQGASLALGLQQRFDFAGLAVAGVAGGVGEVLGGGGRDVWRQVRSGAASAIAGAATRSIVTGTSFGDNVLAVLPDVIGSTIGRLAGHAVAARAAAAAASRSAGRAAVADPQLAIDMTGLLGDDSVTGGGVARGVAAASHPASPRPSAIHGTVRVAEVPTFQGGPQAGQAITADVQYANYVEPYPLTDSRGGPVLDAQGRPRFGRYMGVPNGEAVWEDHGSAEDYLALQRWNAVNSMLHATRLVANDVGGGIYDVGAGIIGTGVAIGDILRGGDSAAARIAEVSEGIGNAIDDPMSIVRGTLRPLEQMFDHGSIRGLTSYVAGSALNGLGSGLLRGQRFEARAFAAESAPVELINPAELRWTQTTAGGSGRAAVWRERLDPSGTYHAYPLEPIDVVRTSAGLTTLDHTRAAVSLEYGITGIPARVHLPTDTLPTSMTGRFGTSTTWGDAAAYRAGRQNPPLPPTGTTTPPRLPRR